MLLLKNKKYLYSDFFTPLPYVIKNKDEYHGGEVNLQGTRYPDVLKLWLSLQHLGNFSYSEIIESSFKYTNFFKRKLLEINNIKIACDPQTNIICFRYEIRNNNINQNNIINLNLQKFLLNKHDIFFSIVEYNNLKWLRAVLLNPFFNLRHIKNICSKVSEFTKESKILKSIISND